MCDACDTRQRRRLWDIEGRWHCSLIGTCLSIGELKALSAKLQLRFARPDPSDYELHGAFVQLAGKDRRAGKLLHKLLDRKFAAFVKRFAAARSAVEVAALWDDARAKGDIAGGFWAALTHPAADFALKERMFGEIHMLSHLVGASNRADLRRLHALERDKAAIEERALHDHVRLREKLAARDRDAAELARQLELAEAERRSLEARLLAVAGGTLEAELSGLRLTLVELEHHLGDERARAGRLEGRLAARERERADLLGRLAAAEQQLRAQAAETAALEESLERLLDGSAEEGAPLDLSGRAILYVGGRASLTCHYRSLVERCNGRFCHHDGGIEAQCSRLTGLMGKVDAVVFPVDCVSHEACGHLKRLCRRHGKPFVPMRGAGLGALLRTLQEHVAA